MNRHCLIKAFVLLQFILSSLYLLAQKNLFPFPSFEKITTRQGLSDNEVYQVTQDKMGFIWFLTNNGLNPYDGYTFKTYDYNPLDSNSITAGFFYSMEQDFAVLVFPGVHHFPPHRHHSLKLQ